jgi:dipeptide/tripeptide permease
LNRDLFGWEMPVSWVNSINPIFIIVLSGVFAALWTKLGSASPRPREVRARGDDHGCSVPAVPAVRRRR